MSSTALAVLGPCVRSAAKVARQHARQEVRRGLLREAAASAAKRHAELWSAVYERALGGPDGEIPPLPPPRQARFQFTTPVALSRGHQHAIKDELLLKGYPAMTSREILDLVLGPGKALHDEDHSYRDRMYLAPSAMHDMHPECTSLCVCMHVARWCRVACGM